MRRCPQLGERPVDLVRIIERRLAVLVRDEDERFADAQERPHRWHLVLDHRQMNGHLARVRLRGHVRPPHDEEREHLLVPHGQMDRPKAFVVRRFEVGVRLVDQQLDDVESPGERRQMKGRPPFRAIDGADVGAANDEPGESRVRPLANDLMQERVAGARRGPTVGPELEQLSNERVPPVTDGQLECRLAVPIPRVHVRPGARPERGGARRVPIERLEHEPALRLCDERQIRLNNSREPIQNLLTWRQAGFHRERSARRGLRALDVRHSIERARDLIIQQLIRRPALRNGRQTCECDENEK